ncbi:hypothetical protein C2857_005571 [Epichloe festucae Fl1]|uniref:AB hydrolase-1 domain-containing protein n=1 Tax=Epichloe festucae (strain Fl1) TaxID=877507 RepID=A0A7S9KSX0_EPIFF|nr:hypothetical protein C2857_005571 [Epichloe festucae Fl1]
MRGLDLWDYVFIRTCIVALRSIAPLSIVYSLASLVVPLPVRVPRILQLWLALEAIFYLAFYLPLREYLQRPAKHPELLSRDDRRKLFWRCHNSIPDPSQYLRKWFRGASEEDIKRENVKDFFRWAFLNTGEVDVTHDEELEEYVGGMEKLLGRKFEPGRGDAECLRLTLDKVEMLHRSLTWYLCVFVVDTIASLSLFYHSFDFHRTSWMGFLGVFPFRPLTVFSTSKSPAKRLTYWHRPHISKTRLPVLFLHGIGVGLYPYVDFLAEINAREGQESSTGDGQVGIIAVEMMWVSSRLTAEAMSKDEMVDEVCRIIKTHGWDKFVLVSHSYGSVIATHLLHSARIKQSIGPVLFIDPVSFLLHLPDVAHNFICRKPSRANEYLLSYFGSRDIGISHTLSRRFFWADNALWKEDLQGHRVGVVLAGRDIVVDTKVVATYLMGSNDTVWDKTDWEHAVWKGGDGLEVLWFGELDHGEAFKHKKTRRRLVRMVRDFCRRDMY